MINALTTFINLVIPPVVRTLCRPKVDFGFLSKKRTVYTDVRIVLAVEKNFRKIKLCSRLRWSLIGGITLRWKVISSWLWRKQLVHMISRDVTGCLGWFLYFLLFLKRVLNVYGITGICIDLRFNFTFLWCFLI